MESHNVRVKSLRLTKRYHINPFNAELHPICHLLALLGAHLIFHVSRIRVKANGERIYSFNQSYPQQHTEVSGRLHVPADVTLGYNISAPVFQRLLWSEML